VLLWFLVLFGAHSDICTGHNMTPEHRRGGGIAGTAGA